MSCSGSTLSMLTYWYPPKGETIVVPFASVVFEAVVAGKAPWVRATVESKMTLPSPPASALSDEDHRADLFVISNAADRA